MRFLKPLFRKKRQTNTSHNMGMKKSYSINQLRDYSSLFSRSEAIKWRKNDFSSLKIKVSRYDLSFANKKNTYFNYLKYIYEILGKFYPNEYVYKNELINKWIINKLGLEDSLIFNEFRLGKAIADIVMFNGSSKVFEIKTLLDKDSRLSNQLSEYSKIFNEIYVIVPEEKTDKYVSIDEKIGIIIYGTQTQNFTLIRVASKNYNIDVDTLMQVLHTNEYVRIVEEYFGYRPHFNDFNKFEVCKSLIKEIPYDALNRLFIKTMKERKINNEFSINEKHLNQLFLSQNLSTKEKRDLLANLDSTIIC